MKLLVITQKVDKNDAILGFFHRWLIEFYTNIFSGKRKENLKIQIHNQFLQIHNFGEKKLRHSVRTHESGVYSFRLACMETTAEEGNALEKPSCR